MSAKTAILYFSRNCPDEAKSKKIFLGQKGNQEFLKTLHTQTRRILKKSGLPIILADRRIQKGDTFTERITTSIEFAFDQGYENLIVVGNDTLGLEVQDISKANNNLDHGIHTIGPSKDGGVYLFTLNRVGYCPKEMRAVPWGSFRVNQSILAIHGHNVSMLNYKSDIDCREDLRDAFAECDNKKMIKILSLILIGLVSIPPLVHQLLQIKSYDLTTPFRGPPALLSV